MNEKHVIYLMYITDFVQRLSRNHVAKDKWHLWCIVFACTVPIVQRECIFSVYGVH